MERFLYTEHMAMPLSPSQPPGAKRLARSLWLYDLRTVCAYSIYSVGVFVFPVTSTSARCMREHVQAPTCVCALRVCVLVYSYAYTFSFLLLSCVRVGARTWTWRTANGNKEWIAWRGKRETLDLNLRHLWCPQHAVSEWGPEYVTSYGLNRCESASPLFFWRDVYVLCVSVFFCVQSRKWNC